MIKLSDYADRLNQPEEYHGWKEAHKEAPRIDGDAVAYYLARIDLTEANIAAGYLHGFYLGYWLGRLYMTGYFDEQE